MPHGDWARRFVHALTELELLVIGGGNEEVIRAIADALDSADIAAKLAKDIELVHGVIFLFATNDDLRALFVVRSRPKSAEHRAWPRRVRVSLPSAGNEPAA